MNDLHDKSTRFVESETLVIYENYKNKNLSIRTKALHLQ